LYNTAAPGFVSEIYTQLVIQITEAIIAAEKDFREAQLFLGRGTFKSHEEIGFQRLLKAYLKNPEAKNVTEDN
jgi:hypothetical protein